MLAPWPTIGLGEPEGVIARDADRRAARAPIHAPVLVPDEYADAPITVGDLLSWQESALALAGPAARREGLDRLVGRPIFWRASAPPPAEPGALVLAPAATLRRLGALLPGALAALARAGVAALVLDPGTALDFPDGAVPILHAPARITEAMERELHRLILTGRNDLYRRRFALERLLADHALGGLPHADLLRLGAAQFGTALYLLDGGGTILGVYGRKHRAHDADPPLPAPPVGVPHSTVQLTGADGQGRWLFARVADHTASGGWLAIGGAGAAFDAGDRLVLLRLATAYAADGQRTPIQRGGLVADLLRPALAPQERRELIEALRLGLGSTFAVVRLETPARVATAWRAARALQRALLDARVRAEVFTDPAGSPAGLFLHMDDDRSASLRAAVAALRAALDDSPNTSAAISAPSVGPGRLPEADVEARYGLALLRAGLARGPLLDWGTAADLGPYRPLYALWGTPLAAEFMRETLGSLLDRDARQIGELLRTLLAYARHGGNGGDAAAELAVHRNTLTYRLRQIAQLTGRSPADPAQFLSLVFAALLWTMPARQEPSVAVAIDG